MSKTHSIARFTQVENSILLIRGHRVILDSDLATMFGISTGRLNEQIRRNLIRFPQDFAFRLTRVEWDSLISQFATSNRGRGGRRKLPYVFTEHGCIMAANVLNSPKAVRASIFIVRAFVKLRSLLASNRELSLKLAELEKRLDGHDQKIIQIIAAIRELMAEPEQPPKLPIGFQTESITPQQRGRARIRKKTARAG